VVKDPAVAEKLVPKKHPFGTKRTPLDTNYYETFNKDSALLIDADTDGPFEEITEKGIRAGGKEYEFDIIVFATGFDAFTGSLKALNIKGRGGRALNDAWADGPLHLSGARGRRVSQPVYDRRSAEPVGAGEHAGGDRAACRMDCQLHRVYARARANNGRGSSRSQG